MSQFILSPKPFKLPSALDVLANPDKGFYFFDDFITDTTKNYWLTSQGNKIVFFDWKFIDPIQLDGKKYSGVAHLYTDANSFYATITTQPYLMGKSNADYKFDYSIRLMKNIGNMFSGSMLRLGSKFISINVHNSYTAVSVSGMTSAYIINDVGFLTYRCVGQTNGKVRYYCNDNLIVEFDYVFPDAFYSFLDKGDFCYSTGANNDEAFIDWIKLEAQYI